MQFEVFFRQTEGLARLRTALPALWDWHDRTREMTSNVLRDGPALPAFDDILAQIGAIRGQLTRLLAEGRPPSPGLLPALTLATEFRTWEIMVAEADLPGDAAAKIFVVWVNALAA